MDQILSVQRLHSRPNLDKNVYVSVQVLLHASVGFNERVEISSVAQLKHDHMRFDANDVLVERFYELGKVRMIELLELCRLVSGVLVQIMFLRRKVSFDHEFLVALISRDQVGLAEATCTELADGPVGVAGTDEDLFDVFNHDK